MQHLHFNPLAVIASGALLWILGALWYSPVLFAKAWMALVNAPKGDKNKALITGMISSFVLDMLMAFVLAHVVYWANASSFGSGVFVGFLMWLGFFAAPSFPQGIYEGRSIKLFLINNGYYLLGLMLMGGLLAIWR